VAYPIDKQWIQSNSIFRRAMLRCLHPCYWALLFENLLGDPEENHAVLKG
jgi:hypothetical protein